jgi:hypothetical protein
MKSVKQVSRALAAVALVGSLGAVVARADIFVLQGEGQVRGALVNRDQSPRKTYVIETASGGLITLDAAQVKEVKRQSPAEMKYDEIRADFPNTVEGQWKLAEWCRDNRLSKQRKTHLEKIIELDANHADARHALGYSKVQGRWTTQDALMKENGYVRYAGRWMLPQEVDILEHDRKEALAQKDWGTKLKRWHAWLDTDKSAQAIENIKAINDPFAAKALARHLEDDSRREVRTMYVEALGRINAPSGMDTLVHVSLADNDEEIRLACLDQVVSHKYKPAVGKYVQALKSKDNAIVNRAAVCLSQMNDTSAVGPLIDALVTTHTFHIPKGQPGQTSATFGTGQNSGSGGFSFGGSNVEIVKQKMENRAVLQALVELTGGVSFNYDVKAWKYWFVAQKKPQTLDARRDGASQ